MILAFPTSYERLSRKVSAEILQAEDQRRGQLMIERPGHGSPTDWSALLEQLESQRDIRVIEITARDALLSWRHHEKQTAC